MKKILTLVIYSCLFVISASAQETATIGGIKYYLDNGKAIIMVQPTTLSGDITIPGKVTYENVTYIVSSIYNAAFENSAINTMTLPNSITSLGKRCFCDCRSLTSVTLPNSITSLGEDCFAGCTCLTNITLPNSITSLGEDCFGTCINLRDITLPNSITSVGDLCFDGCTNLTNITFPNSLTSLGAYCFHGCESLTNISLPNSLTSLGKYCFCDCKSLTSVTLPNSITSLGEDCFCYCKSLTNIILPNSITSLGKDCFCDCSSLTNITLPNSIASLGEYCFQGCTCLTSVTLPNSITSLGKRCFSNCANLMKVTCLWDNLDKVSTDSTAFNSFSETKLYVPKGTKAIYQAKKPWSNFKYIIEEGTTPEQTKQCTTPTISYSDKKLSFASTTTGAQYHYTITDDDIKTDAYSENGTVSLTATYNISVYASADGYTNSGKATAKLYFINAGLENTTGISSAKQRGILIQSNSDFLTVSGLSNNESVSLYNVSGVELGNTKAMSGTATFNVNKTDEVVIVKIGNESIKVKI